MALDFIRFSKVTVKKTRRQILIEWLLNTHVYEFLLPWVALGLVIFVIWTCYSKHKNDRRVNVAPVPEDDEQSQTSEVPAENLVDAGTAAPICSEFSCPSVQVIFKRHAYPSDINESAHVTQQDAGLPVKALPERTRVTPKPIWKLVGSVQGPQTESADLHEKRARLKRRLSYAAPKPKKNRTSGGPPCVLTQQISVQGKRLVPHSLRVTAKLEKSR